MIGVELYCERCGTRYGPARGASASNLPLAQRMLTAVGRGPAVAAPTEAESALRLCLSCRGYSCPACWNDGAGVCQTCAPLPEPEVVESVVARVPALLPPASVPSVEMEAEVIAAQEPMLLESPLEPEIVFTEPETIAAEPETIAAEPEPLAAQPETFAAQPEPPAPFAPAAEPETPAATTKPWPMPEPAPRAPVPPLPPLPDMPPTGVPPTVYRLRPPDMPRRVAQLPPPPRIDFDLPPPPPAFVIAREKEQWIAPIVARHHVDSPRAIPAVRPCTHCDLPVSAAARFCRRCGAAQG